MQKNEKVFRSWEDKGAKVKLDNFKQQKRHQPGNICPVFLPKENTKKSKRKKHKRKNGNFFYLCQGHAGKENGNMISHII